MFKYKRWLYLANDVTSSLLGKEKDNAKQIITQLKIWLLVVILLLLISLIFNLLPYLK